MLDALNRLTVDWSDLPKARQQTKEILTALAEDKNALEELLARAREEEDLFDKCEHHRLLDKLVIYDALDRGFRIRVHVSTEDHRDRPHDHRFSFTSLILRGNYRHVRHELVGNLGDVPNDVQDDFDARESDLRVVPRFVTTERAGNCYTLHHSEIHTTYTTPKTVSLFLRGPAEKERSLITERETGRVWWRFGEDQEKASRRGSKRISKQYFDDLTGRLRAMEVL
ncbi:hypothetical protein ACWT_6097 [Actinoplanes sp. SE50]|uniref:hypothetical protein n=1 Tax=unclassified Actinoplanes TaxID=2626549 RepID=UPI00023ECA23|nr:MULTISPECIES: hypothetical protein [unclassified Actinoplanes]AEV87114.1 hypothetical protein ACPL_6229 [Actinoplanes sp. SE50/110]ATO85512.1 hypothetical protein ACWT_6097 [Actinoplanes sp. SE50]SLM02924.1 uncharacterized protein ACSP50_6209 [Actinoplanes sp. SE50/110]